MTGPTALPNLPRGCDYCEKPTAGRVVALVPGDPGSRRAALDHPGCYLQHLRVLGPGRGRPTVIAPAEAAE
ncbi:hypothetical protein ACEZDB_27395 [Streptacidiphilus sp. N1-3]|uniref:Uncharacterized protein n=1 Tax=Streptacidiphilus alkalitolerans TaxID=3342712 RepID=A0ABV6X7T0_9ACTN